MERGADPPKPPSASQDRSGQDLAGDSGSGAGGSAGVQRHMKTVKNRRLSAIEVGESARAIAALAQTEGAGIDNTMMQRADDPFAGEAGGLANGLAEVIELRQTRDLGTHRIPCAVPACGM